MIKALVAGLCLIVYIVTLFVIAFFAIAGQTYALPDNATGITFICAILNAGSIAGIAMLGWEEYTLNTMIINSQEDYNKRFRLDK